MINILIADNHTLVRKGVQALLAQQPDLNVVAEAETLEDAIEQLRQHRVEVVLLDVSLPGPATGRDGLDLIAQVRALQPRARTVVLTMHTESEYATRALKAGAHGYVTKEVTPELLISAIRRVVSKTINEIAQRLTLSAKTVSAHKLSLLRKLNMRNVAELVRYAIEHEVTLS